MREIKFRTWNKELEIMNYPHNVNNTFRAKIESLSEMLGSMLITGCDFEIMQYTGLKDKKGKEVYEMDICLNESFGIEVPFQCEIVWNKEIGAFQIKYMGANDHYVTDTLRPNEIEVIGNIHEHKELLNKQS